MADPLTVLVGLDGSRRAHEALCFAERLCAQTGWRLVLVGIYPFRPLTGRIGSGDRAAAVLEAARAQIPGGCETHIAPALSAADGLRAVADMVHADLIVIGSRHRGRLGEALAGRTARALVRDGSYAIAIVPAGHRTRAIRNIGMLAEDTEAGRPARAMAAALARDGGASMTVHGGRVPPSPSAATDIAAASEIADELALGELDVLIVPSWPHGLLGRLRRSIAAASSRSSAGSPVLVAARANPATVGHEGTDHVAVP
ncbi:MAG TPA: universal stress protein [Solirubrobacteraceae bacterium]|nr:universal stress protein [Solirubrobacteraceae bacterium]